MKRIALVLFVAMTGGCAVRGNNATTGSAGLQVQSNSLTTVVLTGMFISAAIDEARNPRPFPSMSVFSDWVGTTPPPPLAPDRVVHEQDCSKPIENPTANLRCR